MKGEGEAEYLRLIFFRYLPYNGMMTEAQLTWLDTTLAAAQNSNVCVPLLFALHPIPSPF